ncbi:MAG TPA: hypothetical protein PKM25_10415, partial [Candidatus Ozemobacteraceae bacterium]|nr:hypothetical protein [Candidatus Ozemobacteraceae bacterium]
SWLGSFEADMRSTVYHREIRRSSLAGADYEIICRETGTSARRDSFTLYGRATSSDRISIYARSEETDDGWAYVREGYVKTAKGFIEKYDDGLTGYDFSRR